MNEVYGVFKKTVLLTLALSVLPLTQAEELNTGLMPKWELGLGLAALSRPDYPSADQERSYVLPFPYVIYRGERLKANRDGLRGLLFEHPRWDLDISAGGSLPVNSKDNRAREGMDDLDFSFEFGPSLRFKLRDTPIESLQLRVNLRALLAVDGFPGMSYEGWVLNPELRWQQQLTEALSWGASLQTRYGSDDYHNYFYGVAPRFATLNRPAYQADAGHNSSGVALNVRWHANADWRISAAVSYIDLRDASFNDSPLFKKNSGAYFSLSMARIFWRATKRVDLGPAE